jgi:hypothetical protein
MSKNQRTLKFSLQVPASFVRKQDSPGISPHPSKAGPSAFCKQNHISFILYYFLSNLLLCPTIHTNKLRNRNIEVTLTPSGQHPYFDPAHPQPWKSGPDAEVNPSSQHPCSLTSQPEHPSSFGP